MTALWVGCFAVKAVAAMLLVVTLSELVRRAVGVVLIGVLVRRSVTSERWLAITTACVLGDHDAAREWIVKDLGGAP